MRDELCVVRGGGDGGEEEEKEAAGAELKTKTPHSDVGNYMCKSVFV